MLAAAGNGQARDEHVVDDDTASPAQRTEVALEVGVLTMRLHGSFVVKQNRVRELDS